MTQRSPAPAVNDSRGGRMEIITGLPAASKFRLQKRLRLLGADAVSGLEANFVYFVEMTATLTPLESKRLSELLNDGNVPEPPAAGHRVWVFPRVGTISPWSSKATDIAAACGLTSVGRIERGLVYSLTGDIRSEILVRATAHLHDRMTESVQFEPPQCDLLFGEHSPRPSNSVPLRSDGAKALARANEELGLALSAGEIDYLAASFANIGRDPTDVELMMFSQANSEHCRHKVFNATWVIDGSAEPDSLFAMIRHTSAATPNGILSAYSDNAAVIVGSDGMRLIADPGTRTYGYTHEPIHILMKVETHNHPTAISPFAGAATGAGGEIRDEGATGLGAKPKAGLTGFSVSGLRIPGFVQPWERETGRPDRIASPLEIMLDGPLGAAAFNNEFGRPNLCGYFRTFESSPADLPAGETRGYHKPIMIAGGLGNVREEHASKIEVPSGSKLVVLGGPAMLIGLGGGAASSIASGASSEQLEYASVQRGNPEMQRRAQEVIDRCWSQGGDNPILLIHDVGAGGLSNAIPEAVDHSSRGGKFELRRVPNDEPGMTPMELWCNESQERYVLLVAPDRLEEFGRIAKRERCPYAVVGDLTDDGRLVVSDEVFANRAVDMPMSVLFGNPPKMQRTAARKRHGVGRTAIPLVDLSAACSRVLRHPAVADKSFLIHIGDRTVGGMTARDQMVGPWQVAVSDVAVTLAGFESTAGEAMSMGERTPVAVTNAPASGRLAVAEAVTNIVAADIGELSNVRLSANWMAAAGHPGEDDALFDTVRAVGMQLCPELGIAIPVGKDSLSMRTKWTEGEVERSVVSPVSLIVSAFSPVGDVRETLTPELRRIAGGSRLLLLDLSAGKNRLGGSCLAEVFDFPPTETADLDSAQVLKRFVQLLRQLRAGRQVCAYHDRSDGGLFATVAEMMFASRLGVALDFDYLDPEELQAALFAEEPGAVLQIPDSEIEPVNNLLSESGLIDCSSWIGTVNNDDELTIRANRDVLTLGRCELQQTWSETSYRMQALRDNPETAAQEFERIRDVEDPGLTGVLIPDAMRRPPDVPRPSGRKPRIAILREQGVNSQGEMAAVFLRAGFEATDVHMSDLSDKRDNLANYQGIVACGGFSFGDVLGAGGGWAKSILYNRALRDEFAEFFARQDSFTLGVCNGCQMLAALRAIIPGADTWPKFGRNLSEQFEARFSLVELVNSPSLFFSGMAGARLPIASSHGEGRAEFDSPSALDQCHTLSLVSARYVDGYGNTTGRYPENPNGSPDGICALTSADGRATIIMPHPERVALSVQNSWHPDDWGAEGPWMRMFRNVRRLY